jgi:hypothetical protein
MDFALPLIAGMLAFIAIMLAFTLPMGSEGTIEWGVCEGHGAVDKIVNRSNNVESIITCEDGSKYKLTLDEVR